MFSFLHLPAAILVMVTGLGASFDNADPEPAFQPIETKAVRPPQDSSKTRRQHFTYSHHNGSNATEISYEGDIVFTDDERDIKSISPGGYLKYSKTTFGNTRTLLIESGSNGALKRTYYVGKNEQPYEPEGRKWLADILPDLIASSGIGAKERVKRIYAKEGVNGVLRSLEKVDSDYVKSIYFNYLLEVPSLTENELKTILSQVTNTVSSDYEKGKLLRKVSGTYLKSDRISQQYITAVSSMSSDYEKGQVFKYILKNTSLSEANTGLVIGGVGKLSSDYEKGQVVRSMLKNSQLTDANLNQILQVIATMSSDYEKAQVMQLLLGNQHLSSQNFQRLIGVSSTISSDYEKGNVIASMLKQNPRLVEDHFADVLKLIDNLSSDYEKGKAIGNLLSKLAMKESHYSLLFPVISRLSSDHEKGQVLTRIGKTMPKNNASLVDAFKKTAKTLGSDYEYRRVMETLD